MSRTAVHPHGEISSTSSNHAENDSRCSLARILRARRRGNILLASVLMMVLICAITLPMAIIFGFPDDGQQMANATNTTLSPTTNITTYTPATMSLNEFMNNTPADTPFVSNSRPLNDD